MLRWREMLALRRVQKRWGLSTALLWHGRLRDSQVGSSVGCECESWHERGGGCFRLTRWRFVGMRKRNDIRNVGSWVGNNTLVL